MFVKWGKSTCIMEEVRASVDWQLKNATNCSILDSLQLELMAMCSINMGNGRIFEDRADYCLVQLDQHLDVVRIARGGHGFDEI